LKAELQCERLGPQGTAPRGMRLPGDPLCTAPRDLPIRIIAWAKRDFGTLIRLPDSTRALIAESILAAG
jgi:hypothetical protein